MKEGWTYKKICEVGSVIGGTTPSTQNPNFWGGDVCWISRAELHGERYLYDSVKKITKEAVKAKSLKELPVGTVILSSRAPIGKVAINKIPMYCNQGFKCVVCGKELYNEFLYWWFYGHTDYLNSLGTGATFSEISKSVVENISIPIPPLSEQQRIVAQLDESFAEIDMIKAEAEKQLSDAKALFQKALSQAMTPKEGWEKKKLGDITISMADGPFGSNLKKEHYTTKKEVRIIQLSNIGEEGWREDNTKYTTFEHLKTIQRSEVKPNDIVIAKMMPAGRAILCPNKESAYVLSSDAVRATLKDGLNSRFILFSINSEHFRKQVYANVSGSGRVRTSLTKLKVCSLWLPSLSEQQRIVEELDELSENVKEIEALNNKLTAECDAMKQALLRQVFE